MRPLKLVLMTALALGSTLSATSGCTVSEEAWPTRVAEVSCRRSRQCDRSDFDDTWDDFGECVDSIEDFAQGYLDLATAFGCEYDPSGGQECVTALAQRACDETVETALQQCSTQDITDCS